MNRMCLPRSCLDTEVNIKCRCHQADIALLTIRTVVFRHSQVPTGLKLKFFKTIVISIALSNSEIWTTRQTLLDRLDKWHRLNSPAAQALLVALDVHIRCEQAPWTSTLMLDRHCEGRLCYHRSVFDRSSQSG